MASPGLISVIMPSHNAEATIGESVASALAQTDERLELIVVDDGSTDGTVPILEEMQAREPRLRLIRNPGKRGAGAARNVGIRAASGELLAFLDADDTWAPGCLEKLRRGLASAPDAVLAYCGWQNLGLEPQRCQPYIPPDYEAGDKLEFLLRNCPFPIHAVLVRAPAVLELGGFDERWSSCMDFDLWLRLGWCRKLVRVPEVLAFYHHHDNAARITRNRVRVALNHWRIQRKFVAEHPEAAARLGKARVRDLVHGELMRRGFEAYWKRDLRTARAIFRHVMLSGYGRLREWRYMLPSLIPLSWHHKLIALFERSGARQ